MLNHPSYQLAILLGLAFTNGLILAAAAGSADHPLITTALTLPTAPVTLIATYAQLTAAEEHLKAALTARSDKTQQIPCHLACGQRIGRSASVNAHLRAKHLTPEMKAKFWFRCNSCGQLFLHAGLCQNHKRVHDDLLRLAAMGPLPSSVTQLLTEVTAAATAKRPAIPLVSTTTVVTPTPAATAPSLTTITTTATAKRPRLAIPPTLAAPAAVPPVAPVADDIDWTRLIEEGL